MIDGILIVGIVAAFYVGRYVASQEASKLEREHLADMAVSNSDNAAIEMKLIETEKRCDERVLSTEKRCDAIVEMLKNENNTLISMNNQMNEQNAKLHDQLIAKSVHQLERLRNPPKPKEAEMVDDRKIKAGDYLPQFGMGSE